MRTYTVRLNVALPSAAHESWALSEAVFDRLVAQGVDADLAGVPDDPRVTFWIRLHAESAMAAVTAAADLLRAAGLAVVRGGAFDIISLEAQEAETEDRALASA